MSRILWNLESIGATALGIAAILALLHLEKRRIDKLYGEAFYLRQEAEEEEDLTKKVAIMKKSMKIERKARKRSDIIFFLPNLIGRYLDKFWDI